MNLSRYLYGCINIVISNRLRPNLDFFGASYNITYPVHKWPIVHGIICVNYHMVISCCFIYGASR